jgi:hypothetical protein
VYNEFNARNIGDQINIFKGLQGNYLFAAIIIVTIGVQIFVVEVGGDFTSCTGLTLEFWGWSFLLGAGAWPVGILMRLIPVKEDPRTFANYYNIQPDTITPHSTSLDVDTVCCPWCWSQLFSLHVWSVQWMHVFV